MSGEKSGDGMGGVNGDPWYSDPDLVLAELRHGRASGPRTPEIEGYESFREIGRGGQGAIYEALQVSTRRHVAVKVLLDGTFASEITRRRFEREVELVAALEHPGIVRVYDSGTTSDGRPYLVMQLVDGVPLDVDARRRRAAAATGASANGGPGTSSAEDGTRGEAGILTGGSTPSRRMDDRSRGGRDGDIRETILLMREVAGAVQAAHQHGVIHRDLKPNNILVDAAGHPHVLDFGLARAFRAEGEAAVSATVSRPGQFLGSLPWASPEQVGAGPDRVDARTDVYALGVMFYEALTGRFPYPVDGPLAEVAQSILHAMPAPPSAHRRGIAPDLDAITLTCLAKDPAHRYQSAAALADDLHSFLAGESIRARRDSAWRSMTRRMRRYRLAALIASVGAVAFIAVAGVAWRQAILAEHARELAQQRFEQVRQLANRFLFDVYEEVEPLAGSRGAREMLVTTALEYLQSLAPEAVDDLSFSVELAGAYERVADLQGNPHLPNLGQVGPAIDSYQRSLALRREVAEQRPDDAESLRSLARTLNLTGDALQWKGDVPAALGAYEEAAAILDRASALAPENLGIRRERAANRSKLGDVLMWSGRHQEAVQPLRDALDLMIEVAADERSTTRDQAGVAVSYSKVSFVLATLGDGDGAVEHARQALELVRAAAEREPTDAILQRNLSVQLNQYAATLVATDRLDAARECLKESLACVRRLREADPTDPLLVSDESYTLNKMGELELKGEAFDDAATWFEQAVALRRVLAEKDPENANAQRALAVSVSLIGTARQRFGGDVSKPEPARRQAYQDAAARFLESAEIFESMATAGMLSEGDREIPAWCRGEAQRCVASASELGAEPAAEPGAEPAVEPGAEPGADEDAH